MTGPNPTGPNPTGNDAAMDDIMASIRGAVSIGEVQVDGPPEPHVRPIVTPPGAADGITLEALVRSMLEPMLKAWLDANLPEIVDRAAQAEIARLTRRDA